MTDIANAVPAPVAIHGSFLRHKLRKIPKEQRWVITPDSRLGLQIPLYVLNYPPLRLAFPTESTFYVTLISDSAFLSIHSLDLHNTAAVDI